MVLASPVVALAIELSVALAKDSTPKEPNYTEFAWQQRERRECSRNQPRNVRKQATKTMAVRCPVRPKRRLLLRRRSLRCAASHISIVPERGLFDYQFDETDRARSTCRNTTSNCFRHRTRARSQTSEFVWRDRRSF